MKSKPIKFNGIEFTSLHSLCTHYRVDYERFLYYFSTKKLNISSAITKAREKKLIYKGNEYNSLSELCNDLGLNYCRVNKRLHLGLDLKHAIENPLGFGKNSIEFNGKVYKSYRDIYDDYKPNISYSGFVKRIKRYLGNKELVTNGRLPRKGEFIVYNGVKYRNLKEFYKSINSKYSYVYAANLYRSGIPISRIANILTSGSRYIKCNGIEYKSTSDFIKKNNLKAHRVYRCLKKGYSYEKCLRCCKSSSYCFEYDGTVYESLRKFCEKNNLSYSKMSYRVHTCGLSIYEAVDMIKSA